MRTLSVILILALLVGQTSTSLSAGMTGADLNGFCNASDDLHKSFCEYYILGVTEGLSLGEEADEDKPHFCVPEGITSKQMVLIVQKVMRQAPEKLHLLAVSLVGSAMARAFPCPKSN